jgi:putative component of membrane protein insertase Oxa1/YidC/SpoIIIJ protein YidD
MLQVITWVRDCMSPDAQEHFLLELYKWLLSLKTTTSCYFQQAISEATEVEIKSDRESR